MDPGRHAMIYGGGRRSLSPKRDISPRPGGPRSPRDITAPHRDVNSRVSKPSSHKFSKPSKSSKSFNFPKPSKQGSGLAHNPFRRRPAASESNTPEDATSTYRTQEEQSRQFVADEDKFVLHQSKKKADIRVRERRASPTDILAFHIRALDLARDTFDEVDTDATIDVIPPESVIKSVNDIAGLEALESEITSFHTLEADDRLRDYWASLLVLVRDRRDRMQSGGRTEREGERTVGPVADEVDKIMASKTYEQLEQLEEQIRAKLASDEAIDVDHWEHFLRSLLVWKAKATLTNINKAAREARVEILRTINPDKAELLERTGCAAANGFMLTFTNRVQYNRKRYNNTRFATPRFAISRPAIPRFTAPRPTAAPKPEASSSTTVAPPPGTERFAQNSDDFSSATKALYEREVARGVSENEEIFTAEEALPPPLSGPLTKVAWTDKLRPRKPRYFNRVQMGYEWNKYNQTHYDHDNPPPRVVQGYKFNIFYPELIDKTRAPTFRIMREGGRRRGESVAAAGEEDTCLIRFTAGPPYEDIAFRIVDREWDYSAKRERGFKSSFDKGILQLHFQFKKVFYRK